MADSTSNKPYGNVTYADPKNGKYPIDTEEHIRAAWAYINMPKNASQYPMNGVTLSEVKDRIRAAMKKLGADVASNGDSGRSADSAEREWLVTPSPCEIRSAEGGPRIGGYGAVFGNLSKNLGGFVERVDRGAFDQSRADGWPNIVCRFNHDPNEILGTTHGRTLSLRTDSVGLDYEVLPPQSMQRVVEYVQRGDIKNSSFAFRVAPGGDTWTTTRETNYPLRTLHDVELVDVAPVLDAAYPDATAGLRSLAAAMSAPLEEVRSMAAADELRRFFARTDRPSYQPKVTGAAAMMKLMEKRFGPAID